MGISQHRHGREGRLGARPHDEIGYHAVRTGDNPGEHTIVFGLLGETLEVTVKASSRDCYAIGALAAYGGEVTVRGAGTYLKIWDRADWEARQQTLLQKQRAEYAARTGLTGLPDVGEVSRPSG